MGHTWHEAGQILRLLNDFDVDAFVEIGTNVGGLSSLLYGRVAVCHAFKYLGLELDFSIVNPHVLMLRATTPRFQLLNMNCFSEMTRDTVTRFIENSGRCVLYCDGGNKVKELYHFAPLLRPNDIILCHDYWDGKREVRDVDAPRAEVSPEDVERLFVENGLRPVTNYFDQTRIMGWFK
jgi:hypothetical protein